MIERGKPLATLLLRRARGTTLSDSVKQATAPGTKILVPPQKLPDGDELAILHDPEGVPFGMFQLAAL